MRRKAQHPSPGEYSRQWLVKLVDLIRTANKDDSLKCPQECEAKLANWLADFSAFAHLLACSMTDKEEHLLTAVKVVRWRFLHHALRDAEGVFPVPGTRMVSEKVRLVLKKWGIKWLTVFHRLPRVWVYHRCQEALDQIKFGMHQVEALPGTRPEDAGRPGVPDYSMPAQDCPVNQRGLKPQLVPTARCVGTCRVLFLRWMCFSEEEIGAAVDVPRTTVNRFADTCKANTTPRKRARQRINDVLEQVRKGPLA